MDEEPTDPTDPVEETLPAHSTSAYSIEMPAEIIDTPTHSGELAPIGTSSPIVTSGDGGSDLNEGNQKDDLQNMEAESDEVEKFSLVNEVLEPRGTETTPVKTTSPPEAEPDIKEGSGLAGQIVPTTERCVTPTNLLSTDSPSRPRTSPKRNPPEGSEAATDWESAVKRHCSSTPEHTPFSRLPGRMPYWTPSLAEEVESGAAGGGGDESPMLRGEGPAASPMAPEDVSDVLNDPLSTTPLDRDELSGPLGDEPALAKGVVDPSEEERLPKLSEGEELNAARGRVDPAGTPTETELQPRLGPEASEVDTRPPNENEVRQPSGPETFETGTRPSSPASSQDAEELYDCLIPPFQWSCKELSVSVYSHGNNFESPSVEATTPYQPHIGKVLMRATDWTYYQAQDKVRPIEYHPDWPDEL